MENMENTNIAVENDTEFFDFEVRELDALETTAVRQDANSQY